MTMNNAAMSSPPDPEAQARDSEQTPLLAEQQRAGANEHEAAALLQSHEDENEEKKRGFGWWLWRIFWVVFAGAILGVFIKGWVDARDTDVRTRRATIVGRDTDP